MGFIGLFKKLRRKMKGSLRVAKEQGMSVGQGVSVMGNVNFGSEPYLIQLCDKVRISYDVLFVTHDGGTYAFRNLEKYKNVVKFGKIVVGKGSFIGARSIILPGVKIGEHCVIGAGSVVTKDVPDNSVVCGVPAKVVCSLEQYAEKALNSMPDGFDYEEYNQDKKGYLKRIIK